MDHWVQKLFPPAFHSDDMPQRREAQETVFDIAARSHISLSDVERLKNAFQRVWLLEKLKEQENAEEQSKDQNICDAQIQTDHTEGNSIWENEELSIIRKHLNEVRKENKKLKARLLISETELEKARSKNKEYSVNLAICEKELAEARTANKRLYIAYKETSKESEKDEASLDMFHEEIVKLRKEIGTLMKENHKVRLKLDSERLRGKKLQHDIGLHEYNLGKEKELLEDRLKFNHERLLSEKNLKIEEMKKLLSEERHSHDRTQRGLNQLRTHFANLPFQSPESLVNHNQLSEFEF